MRRTVLAAVLLAALAVAFGAGAQAGGISGSVHLVPPAPLSRVALGRLASDPAALRELAHPTRFVSTGTFVPSGASRWQAVPHDLLPNPGAMLLLTDGSVLVQDQSSCNCGSGDWWRL